jgi:hypothetical protein
MAVNELGKRRHERHPVDCEGPCGMRNLISETMTGGELSRSARS